MRQEDFREFERFCIRYDIAIDVEDYDFGWDVPPGGADWPFERPEQSAVNTRVTLADLKNLGSKCSIDLESRVDEVVGRLGPPTGAVLWSRDCRRLILAKRARGVIQRSHNSTALKSLDSLALYLLAHLPQAPTRMPLCTEWDGRNALDEPGQCEKFLLRLLYLLEISQCYTGFLSIGYADQSLDLLNAALEDLGTPGGRGKSPCELVALYNKGQAYFHVRQYERALAEFEQVREAKNRNEYFARNNPMPWWQWAEADQILFDSLALLPAAVETADVLTNMQRTEEALDVLKSIRKGERTFLPVGSGDSTVGEYWKARCEALEWRAEADLGDIDEDTGKRMKLVVAGLCTPSSRDISIRSQQRASIIEWKQRKCESDLLKGTGADSQERADENAAARNLGKSCVEEFCELSDLIRVQIQENQWDEMEVTEALSLWTEGLRLCAKLLVASKKANRPDTVNVVGPIRKYLDLAADGALVRLKALDAASSDEYRPLAEELRKSLVQNARRLLKELGEYPGTCCDGPILKDVRQTWEGFCKTLVQKILESACKPPLKAFERRNLEEWARELNLMVAASAKYVTAPKDKDYDHAELRKLLAQTFFGGSRHTCPGVGEKDPAEQRCGFKCLSGCVHATERFGRDCAYFEREDDPILPDGVDGRLATMRHFCDGVLKANRARIGKRLYGQNCGWKTPSCWGFAVLKRWNSYTPALTFSGGGGYFLFHTNEKGNIDLGVVIDPGYDFVKNFIHEGFGLSDITAVLISHDHPDHVEDFGKLANLLVELWRGRGRRDDGRFTPVVLGVSNGVMRRLGPTIYAARHVFKDTRVLVPKADWEPVVNTEQKPDNPVMVIRTTKGKPGPCIRVIPTEAIHEDSSECDSIGFRLELGYGCTTEATIGLPCDTKWTPSISEEYHDAQLLCAHVGCLTPERFPLMSYFDEVCTRRHVIHAKQHLYLPGTLWLAESLEENATGIRPRLIVLSEFGEEMAGGLRLDLAKRLEKYLRRTGRKVRVLPGDTGLLMDPVEGLVRCSCCKQFFPWDMVLSPVAFGPDERLYYICRKCRSILTDDQIRHRVDRAAERKV